MRIPPYMDMEVAMDLRVKTTILLSPDMHDQLTKLAERKSTSLGALVREACAQQYGVGDSARRTDAVQALARLGLPVGAARSMKRESVVDPGKLLP